MRVFVLCTGRCGSMTLSRAFAHAENFTVAHESGRYIDWDYPDNHIEIDNRLSWFLGTLAEKYPDARYVHLTRNLSDTIDSFTHREVRKSGALTAHALGHAQPPGFGSPSDPEFNRRVASHYVQTVVANIRQFLTRNTGFAGSVNIDFPRGGFRELWRVFGAVGNVEAALAEFDTRYNGRQR